MDPLVVLVLRLVHIVAGVFWAGAAIFIAGFLLPTINASGPEGGRVMQRLMQQTRLPLYMNMASTLTVLAGLLLYWRASGGLQLFWITSGTGLAFTIGGLAALITFGLGHAVTAPTSKRMAKVIAEIQASGGPPPVASAKELQALRDRLTLMGRVSAILLGVSVVTMAVARYL